MKIYTKTGDGGETSVIGKRVRKNSTTIDTVGNLDELNASLGIVVATMEQEIKIKKKLTTLKATVEFLKNVQANIFSAGAIIAGGKANIDFNEETSNLEKEIDAMDLILKPLSNFILPGGTVLSSVTHFSRTVCRRSERAFVSYDLLLTQDEIDKDEEQVKRLRSLLKYLNRLSDYLFTLARYTNHIDSVEDVLWNPSENLKLGI